MQRSRRTVLASLPIFLAGCGRSFRENAVPGGLFIENRRSGRVTVSVRAARLPPQETAASGEATPTPETPPATAVESADLTGEYAVGAGATRGVPDFFPEAGRWAVEVSVDEDSGNRARIQLYEAIPGPSGADTIRILVRQDDVTARATTVD